LHLGLCALLIPRWGITGAAIATTARFSFDCALLFWAAGKYCGCSLARFWVAILPRVILLGGTLALALYATVFAFTNSWIRLGLGAVWTAVSLLGIWAFAIEREEKPRISGLLRNFLGQPAATT
jgi:peptidoglycan biosynthesis protein MviN/MurJ (putative lipid II flippase)